MVSTRPAMEIGGMHELGKRGDGRQRQTETDRDRQRQTETDRDRQRQTHWHMHEWKQTERDRGGVACIWD